ERPAVAAGLGVPAVLGADTRPARNHGLGLHDQLGARLLDRAARRLHLVTRRAQTGGEVDLDRVGLIGGAGDAREALVLERLDGRAGLLGRVTLGLVILGFVVLGLVSVITLGRARRAEREEQSDEER